MPVVTPARTIVMDHEKDPKIKIREDVGDISTIEIFNNQVLAAIYIRPKKTSGGILLPGSTVDEDRYQSKIGLILKKGPSAFADPTGEWFAGADIKEDDWILFRPSEGWTVTINGVTCRVVDDTAVRGRVNHPDQIW